MRRPMIPAAAGLSLGIFLEYHLPYTIWIGILTLPVVLFFTREKKHRALCVFLIFLSLGSFCLWNSDRISRENTLPIDEEISLTGEVLSLKTKEAKNHQMEVRTQRGRVLVRWYEDLPKDIHLVGREINVEGSFEAPPGRRNPKCFDYRLYLKTRKIDVMMTGESLKAGRVVNPLTYYATKASASFEKRIQPFMDEERRELVIAMMFGDKSGLEEGDYEKFQRNGTAHLLAASGLHVGVVYGFIAFLLRGKRRFSIQLLIMASLVFYAAMAGFAPSIVRAVIMIILHIIARLFHYRYDLLSAASFTALVMLVANPYALFGLGFQMSFLAILSLSMFIKGDETGNTTIKVMKPIVVIQCAMAPFTAYTFNYFSLMAFLANVPLIFLAGILLPVGIVAMGASIFSGFPVEFAGTMLDVVSGIMIKINDIFYGEGGGAVDVVSPPVFLLAVYYLLGFYYFSELRRIQTARKERGKILVWTTLLLLTAGIFSVMIRDDLGGHPIVFVDVGQGSCLCITTPDDRTILVDGGGSANYDVGKKTLKPYLLKNGIGTVDIAIVSHGDIDHYGGIEFLHEDGMVEKLVFVEGQEEDADLYVSKGDVIYREDDFSILVLGPEEGKSGSNEGSMVVKINYGDISILAPGDISSEEEEELVRTDKKHLSADILAVPHHGSKYSSSDDFIDAVNPQVGVIQVGKNNYGHPAPSVIEKYRERGIILYRTDGSGAIAIGGGENGRIQLQTQQ